jgi:phosphoglycolate phosphatase-like HAD superfamily hydrolase
MAIISSECLWDTFDAYLFDVDGTLIHCTDATHYFAFCDVLKMISGSDLTLEGITAHGNVDNGILRDAFTLAGVSEEAWRPRLQEIHAHMGDFVEARQQELCTTVLPRVHVLLEHLRVRGAKLCLATGNIERIGRLKLLRAGLLELFDIGGWSDRFEYRSDVFRSAVAMVREQYGIATSICVVGDTPMDIKAAHDNSLPVIAVATGIYSFEQLRAEQPEFCLRTFGDLLNEP